MLEVVNTYNADDHTKEMVQKFLITPPDNNFNYPFTAGVLRYEGRLALGKDTAMQTKLIASLHHSSIGGHSRIRATYQRVKKLFYWPGLKQDVQNYVTACPICQ
jgi:hypothetical protein